MMKTLTVSLLLIQRSINHWPRTEDDQEESKSKIRIIHQFSISKAKKYQKRPQNKIQIRMTLNKRTCLKLNRSQKETKDLQRNLTKLKWPNQKPTQTHAFETRTLFSSLINMESKCFSSTSRLRYSNLRKLKKKLKFRANA